MEIRKVVEIEEITYYCWECPGCGKSKKSKYEPDEDQLLCDSCEEEDFKRREKEFFRNFRKAYKHLLGATIIDVEPDRSHWGYPDTVSAADILGITLLQQDGQVVAIEPHWELFAIIEKSTSWFNTEKIMPPMDELVDVIAEGELWRPMRWTGELWESDNIVAQKETITHWKPISL